jgi:hypothetical protein
MPPEGQMAMNGSRRRNIARSANAARRANDYKLQLKERFPRPQLKIKI